MIPTETWYVIGAFAMAAGTGYATWGYLVDSGHHGRYYAVLAAVTGIATLAYGAMALGIGRIHTVDGVLYLPRYVDWVLTTPLLLLYLAMLARPTRRAYVTLIGLVVFVIASGITAGLLPKRSGWLAWGAGLVAFAGILALLVTVLPRQATLDAHRPAAVFTKLRNLTIVLWSIYPIVWALGPFGLDLLLVETEAIVVTYLDVLSKVGFVVIAVNGRDALDRIDGATGGQGAPAD